MRFNRRKFNPMKFLFLFRRRKFNRRKFNRLNFYFFVDGGISTGGNSTGGISSWRNFYGGNSTGGISTGGVSTYPYKNILIIYLPIENGYMQSKLNDNIDREASLTVTSDAKSHIIPK